MDTPPASAPNIVVILADDLGFGDLGCYNPDSRIPTPRIDALARDGLRFLDAHSPSAVCTPSRYGLLTGRYGWRGPLPYGVLYGYEPPLIEPERTTLASLLKGAGYRTACIGKWHLGLGFSTYPDADIDFDRPLPWENASRTFEEGIDLSAPLRGGPTELGFDRFFGSAGCPTCQPPYASPRN
jgi:arylsulfatase A-like enzyme